MDQGTRWRSRCCLKVGKLGLGGYTDDPNMKYVMWVDQIHVPFQAWGYYSSMESNLYYSNMQIVIGMYVYMCAEGR